MSHEEKKSRKCILYCNLKTSWWSKKSLRIFEIGAFFSLTYLVFWSWTSSCPGIICWIGCVYFIPHVFVHLCQVEDVCGYGHSCLCLLFCLLACVCLVLVPCCLYYYSSVIHFEIWNGDTSHTGLFAQDCFVCPWSFVVSNAY